MPFPAIVGLCDTATASSTHWAILSAPKKTAEWEQSFVWHLLPLVFYRLTILCCLIPDIFQILWVQVMDIPLMQMGDERRKQENKKSQKGVISKISIPYQRNCIVFFCYRLGCTFCHSLYIYVLFFAKA